MPKTNEKTICDFLNMIGNKTHCDICNTKTIRKARKKEQKEGVANADPPVENVDDMATATAAPPQPTTSQHHHSSHVEGIILCQIVQTV